MGPLGKGSLIMYENHLLRSISHTLPWHTTAVEDSLSLWPGLVCFALLWLVFVRLFFFLCFWKTGSHSIANSDLTEDSPLSLTPHRYWFEKCHRAWHFGKFRTMNHCSPCSRLAENRHQCHKFSPSPGNKLHVAKWSTQSHTARTEPRFNTNSVWYTKTWLCTQCRFISHRHFLLSYR